MDGNFESRLVTYSVKLLPYLLFAYVVTPRRKTSAFSSNPFINLASGTYS